MAAEAEHRFALRVWYEDTDLAGIVYYANYLKFIERARSQWIEDLGIDQLAMKAETGTVFAVRRLEADYHAPARFADQLEVRTRLVELKGARLTLAQDVTRLGADGVLFASRVVLVALGEGGRPARLPEALRLALAAPD